MTLENVFYTLGIIYFVAGIILLIALVVVAFYIKGKIDEVHSLIDEKIDQLKNKPGDFAMDVGATVAASAIKGIKNMFSR